MTRGRTCLPTVTATSTRSSVAWARVTQRRATTNRVPSTLVQPKPVAAGIAVPRSVKRSEPRPRRRRIGRAEQLVQLAYEGPVPVGRADEEQALHAPCGVEPRAQRLDLRREAPHRLAAVEEEVPDLDDRRLAASGATEQHVDRARPASLVERRLRDRRPAAGLRRRDDEVLPPQVLDVPGQVRTGHRLDERRQLHVERRRAGAQRLERRAWLSPSFDPAEVRLRDPRGGRDVDLDEDRCARRASFRRRPDPCARPQSARARPRRSAALGAWPASAHRSTGLSLLHAYHV